MGLREMLFFCRGWTWKKLWRTAMADSPKSASIEKMCQMKRWVGQFSGFGEAEVLLVSRPDSKDLRDCARLPTAIDHGFELRTSNRVN